MAKNTPNVIYRDDGNILVKNVRLSYPHLFTPWSQSEFDEHGNKVKKKFSGSFIMPLKTHKEDVLGLRAHLKAMAIEAFKSQIKAENYFLRDGNLMGKEEYAESYYCAASQSEDRQVKVIDRKKSIITAENNNNRIYAGCRVNVLLRPWAQNNKFGKKINANLLIVQFVKDDEAFGDGALPDVDDVFEDISGEFEEEEAEAMEDDDIPF